MSQIKRSTFQVICHSKSRCILKGKKSCFHAIIFFNENKWRGKTHKTISAPVPSPQLLTNISLCSWNSSLTSSVLELSRKQILIRVSTESENKSLIGWVTYASIWTLSLRMNWIKNLMVETFYEDGRTDKKEGLGSAENLRWQMWEDILNSVPESILYYKSGAWMKKKRQSIIV